MMFRISSLALTAFLSTIIFTDASTNCPTPEPSPAPSPEPICAHSLELDQRVRCERQTTRGKSICDKDADDGFGKLGDAGELSFRFVGGDESRNRQEEGKVVVEGAAPSCDDDEPVTIIVCGEEGIDACSGEKLFFEGTEIYCGDTFTASGKFKGATYIHVIHSEGVQTTEFHTSCSQPISVGDIYGSNEIVGFCDEDSVCADEDPLDLAPGPDDEMYATCHPGDTVVFTYKVSTEGGIVNNVNVVGSDEINGEYEPRLVEIIGGDVDYTLEAGETWLYVYSFELATNATLGKQLAVSTATGSKPGCKCPETKSFVDYDIVCKPEPEPSSSSKSSKSKSSRSKSKKSGSKRSGSMKSGSKKSGSTKSGSKKSGSNKSGSKKSGSNKSGSNKSGSNKSRSNKSGSNKSRSNKSGSNKSSSSSRRKSGTRSAKSGSIKSGSTKSGTGEPEYPEPDHTPEYYDPGY